MEGPPHEQSQHSEHRHFDKRPSAKALGALVASAKDGGEVWSPKSQEDRISYSQTVTTRRQFVWASAAAAVVRAGTAVSSLKIAPSRVVLADGSTARHEDIELTRRFDDSICRATLRNRTRQPVSIREIVLFEAQHNVPGSTPIYGESFQMLSQTGGTLASPVDLGYSERKHYRIPQPDDATSIHGLLAFSPAGEDHVVYAFTSCRRFSGRFYLRASTLDAVLDTEGLTLAPGQVWQLEEFWLGSGPDLNVLLDAVGRRMASHHPPLASKSPPAGWCSWYCFGPRVTAANVLDNLDFIAKSAPGLKYIQLDDGYQAAMGDWLDAGAAFGGDVRKVLKDIKARGFEPAIWVAPFVAEAGSQVFQQHPDWFVKDAAGQPLDSGKVTFKGWRRGPWYALDGTHPGLQAHLTEVFRVMRREWGCTYFKLDANFWGAIHGGRFHDAHATRIEAYRRGMQAIQRGAGDSFLLGCNHPMWASLGLIHGSRSSEDIGRKWSTIVRVARQNLLRNWQNGKLWWNDPDCVVLTGDLPEEEFRFHATATYASGGLILSGDDLTHIAAPRLAMLREMLPPTGVAARFEDSSLSVGRIELRDRSVVCLLNWSDTPASFSLKVMRPSRVREVWTGQDFGELRTKMDVSLPARAGRLFTLTAA